MIALEWLDPPFVGGHWVPEMVSIAGGEDVAGPPGLKSPEVEWETLSGARPRRRRRDALRLVRRAGAASETLEHWDRVAALGAGRVFAVDAASTFSRPGPRLVDGVELLGHLLHPDLVEAPGSIGFAELALRRRRATLSRAQATTIAAAKQIAATAAIAAISIAERGRGPSIPRSPATITRPQSRPPASPPRWPPMLMLLIAEGEGEVDQQQDAELVGELVDAAAPGDQEGGAEDPEDRAGGADRDLQEVGEQRGRRSEPANSEAK